MAKPLEKLSPAERDKRIAQLIKNPGTRAAVPTKYLPAAMRRMRERNTRMRAPIVAGSTITNRDLANESAAAVTEKYGLADTQATQEVATRKQRETEVAGWYDQFLKDLQTHRTNTATAQTTAQGQIANIGKVQGPPGAQAQDGANEGVEANAKAIRDALLGAMQTQFVEQGRASTTYADTLANVVGPGQKLGAQTKASQNTQTARDTLGALAREKGAFRTTYEAQARNDEGKNVLSRQALGLDATKAQLSAEDSASQLNSYGFTKAEWAALPESTRTEYRTGANKPKSTPTTGYGAGRPGLNKYGYSYDEWNALSPAARTKARAGKPKVDKPLDEGAQYAKDFRAKYGVNPASAEQVANATSGIQVAGNTVATIRASNPKMTRRELGQLLLSGQPGVKDDPKTSDTDETSTEIKPVKGIWATVALDLAFLDGRISAGTADRLHRAGYSVPQLGLKTVTRPNKGSGGNAPSRTGRGDVQTGRR